MESDDFDFLDGRAAEIVSRFFAGSSEWDASDIRELLTELRAQKLFIESLASDLRDERPMERDIGIIVERRVEAALLARKKATP